MQLAVGTDKGLFALARSAAGWVVSEPHFLGWRVTALHQLQSGGLLAGTASGWFGPAIHRSAKGTDWEQVAPGPQYVADGRATLEQFWRFHETLDALYVGVAHAGLFRSDDHGTTWAHVEGLRAHPSSPNWQPGAGGLCAHSMLHHPVDPNRLWLGVSAVGVFRSDDGGESWQLRNEGVRVTGPDADHDIGYCVHALVLDPDDPDVLFRQDHQGLYRSDDGADTWVLANDGVPSRFGFPLVMDTSTRHLFAVPQESDEHRIPVDGRLRVYRSADGARSWHEASVGLPDVPSYAGVLRGAMATDNDGLVAFGTTSGELYVTEDSGDSWGRIDVTLPRVFCVAAFDL